MSATVTIPAHQWSGETTIEIILVDQYGARAALDLSDQSGFVAGVKRFTVDSAGYELTLPCNDELPSPPGQDDAGTWWRITVLDGREPIVYDTQIVSTSSPTTWSELIAAGTPVDPATTWAGRLLPSDATIGQYARLGADNTWEAVDPPAGTGDVVGPASATDGNLVVFNGTTGKLIAEQAPSGLDAEGFGSGSATDGYVLTADGIGGAAWEEVPATGGGLSDGDTLSTGLTFPLDGLHILDTDASHDLILSTGSDLTADRTLTLTTGDADRTLTLGGDATLNGGTHSGTNTGDQDLSGYVAKALFDANTILASTSDDTPAALTVAEQTLVGRITGGAITALTATEVRTLLNVADGATADGATGDAFATSHLSAYDHSLIATALQSADIDTLAELNAIITDATLIDTADSRLSDPRTPTAHASTHATGQSDAIAPAGIGAATSAQGALADTALQPSDLASGTITPRTGAIDFSGGSDGDVLTVQADGSLATEALSGGGDALTSNPLSQFAATTSAQLAGVISDETGSGALVFASSPTLVTPTLGTPASGTLTNCTGYPLTGIATGTITPRADDIDFSGGSDGDVLTVQADGSLAVETPSGGSTSTNDIEFADPFEPISRTDSDTLSVDLRSIAVQGTTLTTGTALTADITSGTSPANAAQLAHIYVYNSSGSPALELSATEPTWNSTYRCWQKTSDATRRWVGAWPIYLDGSTYVLAKGRTIWNGNSLSFYFEATVGTTDDFTRGDLWVVSAGTATTPTQVTLPYCPENAHEWYANAQLGDGNAATDATVALGPENWDNTGTHLARDAVYSARVKLDSGQLDSIYFGRAWILITTPTKTSYALQLYVGTSINVYVGISGWRVRL